MTLSSWIKETFACPFAKCVPDAQAAILAKPQPCCAKPGGFLDAVKQAELAHPLPRAPTPPDPNDPKYAGNADAFAQAQQTYEQAAAAFAESAKLRGSAVAGVIGAWLAEKPLALLQELLDQPAEQMPIFSPVVGPVIVMRHEHILKCLERTDLFTVDRYAPEMARATDDKTKNPGSFGHFMLGTDDDALYRLDDVLLRSVVTPNDTAMLTAIARKAAKAWLDATVAAGTGIVDITATIAREVPLRIVSEYLGVHGYAPGETSVLPGRNGGDSFPLNTRLQQVFTFQHIQTGIVPTWDHLHLWIQDTFRNIFNNNNPASPHFQQFRERGIIATEYLTAYIHELIEAYNAKSNQGEALPDTMLTRLLLLQKTVQTNQAGALENRLAALLGRPLAPGELQKRLTDSMIRSNVFGTAVGAVANPQEAMTWIVDAMLRLQDGEYTAINNSSFARAVQLANIPEEAPEAGESLQTLRKYALEALRLQPQGEVLLRVCVKDNNALANVPIRKGTLVFVGYAGAMRDPAVIPQPLAFDVSRDEHLSPYLGQAERKNECPQSQTYLQHGYARHKCLGRYASEITMQESLRAVLRLGSISRIGPVQMDAQNLYPASLLVKFTCHDKDQL